MATASTTAWVLHDLGLAAGFGGSLFGQMALNPAVKEHVGNAEEKFHVLDQAWGKFRTVQALSLGLTALSWLVGRAVLSGRFAGRDVHRFVIAKDVILGATVATGVASTALGAMVAEEHERGVTPSESPRMKRLVRAVQVAGTANIAALAAAIGITTVLAMKSGKSTKWSAIARLLP